MTELPDQGYEDGFLARAFRALLAPEDFGRLLCDIVETARVLTGCEHVVVARTPLAANVVNGDVRLHGPWAAPAGNGHVEDALPSLELPIVVDGYATHVMSFYKRGDQGRYSPEELAHARRVSELAALVLSGLLLPGDADGRTFEARDPGVPGRDEFEDEVLAAVEEHNGKAALLIVRVSDLDVVNRRLGRDVGDEVLRLVARTMREVIGSSGTVGRVNRHEFAAVLPGLDFARAKEIARTMDRLFTNPQPVLGRDDVHATIAVGVAAATEGAVSSVAPLFHETYKSLEREVAALQRRPRTSSWS
jgi:diguanylate cyclase (GGDEF)-like protein